MSNKPNKTKPSNCHFRNFRSVLHRRFKLEWPPDEILGRRTMTTEQSEQVTNREASATLDTQAVDLVDLFDNLGGPYAGQGRDQLTNAQKDGFLNPIAEIAGVDRERVDIRTLNDEKQTRRSLSESTFARVQSDIEMLDWVFVGRCSGEQDSYEKILSYMANKVRILAGISIFVGALPNWHVIGLYYDSENAELAKRISDFLAFDFSEAIEVRVRDRRNLTKNLSDLDDPLVSDVFLSESSRTELVSELMRKKCIAIQGPPGTGKTVVAKSISLEVAQDENRVLSLQFHQSYSYEDFIRGWRPTGDGNLELTDGTFLKFCERARSDAGNPYVVFIDEVNRANISLVFGEVLSLIEATKRDKKFSVDLAYGETSTSSEPFYVPKNVFLITTMNTADRSLAVVDYALRRRFSFIDLLPAYGETEFHSFVQDNGIPNDHAREISARMIALNDSIRNDNRNLGTGYQIGHSYFCGKVPDGVNVEDWYQNIVAHEIAPLLREYWADEEELANDQIAKLSLSLPTT